jgi:hypothetical protein
MENLHRTEQLTIFTDSFSDKEESGNKWITQLNNYFINNYTKLMTIITKIQLQYMSIITSIQHKISKQTLTKTD